MATNPSSQPTDEDPMADEPVELIEAFYHPRFGAVLWHAYVNVEGTFVMSARINIRPEDDITDPEKRAQQFVNDFTDHLDIADKPRFSAN